MSDATFGNCAQCGKPYAAHLPPHYYCPDLPGPGRHTTSGPSYIAPMPPRPAPGAPSQTHSLAERVARGAMREAEHEREQHHRETVLREVQQLRGAGHDVTVHFPAPGAPTREPRPVMPHTPGWPAPYLEGTALDAMDDPVTAENVGIVACYMRRKYDEAKRGGRGLILSWEDADGFALMLERIAERLAASSLPPRAEPRNPKCPAVNRDGYDCELEPNHDGDHRSVIGEHDEQGEIPEVRWRETDLSTSLPPRAEGPDDYRLLTGCSHALHESCANCVCGECGTRVVRGAVAGTAITLPMTAVQRAAAPAEAPTTGGETRTLRSFVGSVPNLTGGLDAVEYLRRNRERDEPTTEGETEEIDTIIATLEGGPTVADAKKPLALRIAHAIHRLKRLRATLDAKTTPGGETEILPVADALADELESDVRARYDYPNVHPALQHKYERDLDSVTTYRRLRATLDARAGEDDEPCDCPTMDVLEVLCRVFDDGADVAMDEWRAWYQPGQWLHPSRALGAFIRRRLDATAGDREAPMEHGFPATLASESALCAAEEAARDHEIQTARAFLRRNGHAVVDMRKRDASVVPIGVDWPTRESPTHEGERC